MFSKETRPDLSSDVPTAGNRETITMKQEDEYKGIRMKEEDALQTASTYCTGEKYLYYNTNSIYEYWDKPDPKLVAASKEIQAEGGWITEVLMEVECSDVAGEPLDPIKHKEYVDVFKSIMDISKVSYKDKNGKDTVVFKTRTLKEHPCNAGECDGWTGAVNVTLKYTSKCR